MNIQTLGKYAQNSALDRLNGKHGHIYTGKAHQHTLATAKKRFYALFETFHQCIDDRENPRRITPADCYCVIEDAEQLIAAMRELQGVIKGAGL